MHSNKICYFAVCFLSRSFFGSTQLGSTSVTRATISSRFEYMKRQRDFSQVDVLDVLSSFYEPSSSSSICYQVLGWLAVQEGVLPVHLKQPITSAQFAERILRVELDYLNVQKQTSPLG